MVFAPGLFTPGCEPGRGSCLPCGLAKRIAIVSQQPSNTPQIEIVEAGGVRPVIVRAPQKYPERGDSTRSTSPLDVHSSIALF